jgi:thiamine biosynthesis protein ThiI
MGIILLRYGELALKGRNRNEFVRRLRSNIRACLKTHAIQGDVESVGQRIYVYTEQVAEALDPMTRVFGLVSVSPGVQVACEMQAIVDAGISLAQESGVSADVSFRVRARRADKAFPATSPEISRIVGEAIQEALGAPVDLSDRADVTIGVEVSEGGAFLFGRVLPAPKGLPLGVEGRVVALISGGIDSPVAAWMMMKRGCGIIPVHFAQSESEASKAQDNIAVLQRWAYGWTLHPVWLDQAAVVAPILQKLRDIGQERWACVFCKRAIMLKACELANEAGAHAIVMGDSLGQVASQTLANLAITSYQMPKPVLRPLIGFDKAEIVALARQIGTFDISTRSAHACPFLPANPITRGSLEGFQRVMQQLELVEKETCQE